LIYVILGRCAEYGIPISAVFAEVHASNMTKLGDDGKPVHREDGKVVKGPNWRAPRITEIMEYASRHAQQPPCDNEHVAPGCEPFHEEVEYAKDSQPIPTLEEYMARKE
jgi:predicted HAD superfamily Cof-like phosphohydrolase